MWVKIITIETDERGGSVTYPRAVRTEKKRTWPFERVGVYRRTRGYPSSPTAGLLRARRWFRQPAAITSLPEWDFQREERENTYKQCFWEREREGDHRQFTLFKRQSVEKVEQLPRQRDDGSMLLVFILNSLSIEKLTWRSKAKLEPSSWLARSDYKRVARCLDFEDWTICSQTLKHGKSEQTALKFKSDFYWKPL